MKTKVCTKCGLEKSLPLFHSVSKTGRPKSTCIECDRAYSRGYVKKNKHKILAKSQSQRDAERAAKPQPKGTLMCQICNTERPFCEFFDHKGSKIGKKAKCIPCYKNEPRISSNASDEEKRAAKKASAKRYHDLNKADEKAYAEANKEKIAKRVKEYNLRKIAENPDYSKQRNKVSRDRKFARMSPEERQEWNRQNVARKTEYDKLKRSSGARHGKKDWAKLLAMANGRCLRCGTDKTVGRDHVVPLTKGGNDGIMNIQPLCYPCNSSKNDDCTDYRTPEFLAAMAGAFDRACLYCNKKFGYMGRREKYCTDKCNKEHFLAKRRQATLDKSKTKEGQSEC